MSIMARGRPGSVNRRMHMNSRAGTSCVWPPCRRQRRAGRAARGGSPALAALTRPGCGAWAGGVRHGLVRYGLRGGAACPRGERYIVMYLVTFRTRFDEHAVN